MKKTKKAHKKILSVVLATRNEEVNIGACLDSVKAIADEMIVVDEGSVDRTRDIAKNHGAIVYKVSHEPIFHKTKQKALEKASGEWILQLDADERVTPALSREILEVIRMPDDKILTRTPLNKTKWGLFKRHQLLLIERDGKIGTKEGPVVAFFVPRINFFMGKPLIYGGVYPDGVIRLVKNGYAKFPAKSVHEQMEIQGRVAWLVNDLEHHDSPTFERYINRNSRYTDLISDELIQSKIPKNPLYFLLYTVYKPLTTFLSLYIRHKGFLDGYRGFIWAFFSATRFAVAFSKYLKLT
jgi:glycosyltransferase involved in cell wall biosynthesis